MSGRPQHTFFMVALTPKETAYDTPIADGSIDKWYTAEEAIRMVPAGAEDHDQDEIKGTSFPTDAGPETNEERFTATIRMKANTEILPLLLMSATGVVDTTGVGPYVHSAIDPGPQGVDVPFSTSIICAGDRFDTGTFFKYSGVVVSRIKLEQEKGQPLFLEFDIITSGTKAAVPGISVPAIPAVRGTRLHAKHLVPKLGPALEAVTSIFRSLELELNFDLITEPVVGSTKIASVLHGDGAPTLTGQLVLDGKEGSTEWGYWNSRTQVKCQLTWTESVNGILDFLANSVFIPIDGLEHGYANGVKPTLTLPLTFEFVGADQTAYKFDVTNQEAAYLA